jgi:hypothetical protein
MTEISVRSDVDRIGLGEGRGLRGASPGAFVETAIEHHYFTRANGSRLRQGRDVAVRAGRVCQNVRRRVERLRGGGQ